MELELSFSSWNQQAEGERLQASSRLFVSRWACSTSWVTSYLSELEVQEKTVLIQKENCLPGKAVKFTPPTGGTVLTTPKSCSKPSPCYLEVKNFSIGKHPVSGKHPLKLWETSLLLARVLFQIPPKQQDPRCCCETRCRMRLEETHLSYKGCQDRRRRSQESSSQLLLPMFPLPSKMILVLCLDRKSVWEAFVLIAPCALARE